MNLTMGIALFGAITGGMGLTLNYLSYRRTAPHLRIKKSDKPAFYYADTPITDSEFSKHFMSNALALIPFEITNKSDKPITIYSISSPVRYQTGPMLHFNEMSISNELLTFNNKENDLDILIVEPQSFKLPLRLEPYDFISGTVRFPFFEHALIEGGKEPNITVLFYTSRRTYRKRVQLSELHESVHRRYPRYKDKFE